MPFSSALPAASPYLGDSRYVGSPTLGMAPREGDRVSHYRPVTAHMELLWKTIAVGRPYDTCEAMVQDIFRLHAATLGKRVRITTEMRHLLLRLHGLVHQYRKTTKKIIIPTGIAGRTFKARQGVIRFLRILEEMGAIRQKDGHWIRHGGGARGKAVSYTVASLFRPVLDRIYQSYTSGYLCSFIEPKLQCSLNYYYKNSKQPHSSGFYNRMFSAGVISDVIKSHQKSMSEAIQRRNRICRLWNAPDAYVAALIKKKARLSKCHVGLGAEASDVAVTHEIHEKYHFSRIAEASAAADVSLPAEYMTRFNVNIERDVHGNICKIGCRPYNSLCGTKNEYKPDSVRPAILRELGMWHHYDVRCSIYNVSVALRTGKFGQADYYSRVAKCLHMGRDTAKDLFMRANFGALSESVARNPFAHTARWRIGGSHITYGEFQCAMRTCGLEPMGTDTAVFYHEGAIYAIARRILLEEYGIRSICVFDSFYTDAPVDDYMDDILNAALSEYLGIIGESTLK